MIAQTISCREIHGDKHRFEGSFYLNNNSVLGRTLEKNQNKCTELGQIASVFNPGIFKRMFCIDSPRAVQYFQSSDVPHSSEKSPVFVSRKQAKDMNLLVKTGDILVTGFGTIGNSRIVTKHQHNVCYANNVCRIRACSKDVLGHIYAVLNSKYGKAQLEKNASGSVVRYIEAPGIKKILIPRFTNEVETVINDLIMSAVALREEATDMLYTAEKKLKQEAGLTDLTPDDYDYYGQSSSSRTVSCFSRNIQEIGITSINAFNHSERIKNLKKKIGCNVIPLKDAIENGQTFSSTGLPNNEVKPGHGILLINQKDIFDNIVSGKWISSKGAKLDNLVDYGEILIACDGTLGESELFCKAIYANEDLKGAFVSSHFIRMKSNSRIPSGYLFSWLNSDYGFRLIRNTQAGTKLCHPINKLFLQIPVPLLNEDIMKEIDSLVQEAHNKRYIANQKEMAAIKMVEQEIEKWNN